MVAGRGKAPVAAWREEKNAPVHILHVLFLLPI